MESREYAIIATGGKQYQVAAGQKVYVERIEGEIGASVSFNQVLLVNPGEASQIKIGTPLVAGAAVTAKIVRQDRAPKVVTYKKTIKQGYTKKQGHRQERTQVVIERIEH